MRGQIHGWMPCKAGLAVSLATLLAVVLSSSAAMASEGPVSRADASSAGAAALERARVQADTAGDLARGIVDEALQRTTPSPAAGDDAGQQPSEPSAGQQPSELAPSDGSDPAGAEDTLPSGTLSPDSSADVDSTPTDGSSPPETPASTLDEQPATGDQGGSSDTQSDTSDTKSDSRSSGEPRMSAGERSSDDQGPARLTGTSPLAASPPAMGSTPAMATADTPDTLVVPVQPEPVAAGTLAAVTEPNTQTSAVLNAPLPAASPGDRARRASSAPAAAAVVMRSLIASGPSAASSATLQAVEESGGRRAGVPGALASTPEAPDQRPPSGGGSGGGAASTASSGAGSGSSFMSFAVVFGCAPAAALQSGALRPSTVAGWQLLRDLREPNRPD